LAFIHTGVPWHTFWLQPQFPSEVGSIPDWAVLDLFSALDAATQVGRLNINAWITPDNAGTFPPRLAPLYGLLTNRLGIVLQYREGFAVTNMYIAEDTTNVFSRFGSFPTNVFAFVGEVCEVSGLATNDLSNSSKARWETPVRGIANLITPRSNVFTIWAVAQAIKDVNQNRTYEPTPTGPDFITGEAKVQAVVERYEESGVVKLRIRYYRYIYD
jgi:hypothetical protein